MRAPHVRLLQGGDYRNRSPLTHGYRSSLAQGLHSYPLRESIINMAHHHLYSDPDPDPPKLFMPIIMPPLLYLMSGAYPEFRWQVT